MYPEHVFFIYTDQKKMGEIKEQRKRIFFFIILEIKWQVPGFDN